MIILLVFYVDSVDSNTAYCMILDEFSTALYISASDLRGTFSDYFT